MLLDLKIIKNPVILGNIYTELQIVKNGALKGVRMQVIRMSHKEVYVELYNRKSTDHLPPISKHVFKSDKLACEFILKQIDSIM